MLGCMKISRCAILADMSACANNYLVLQYSEYEFVI